MASRWTETGNTRWPRSLFSIARRLRRPRPTRGSGSLRPHPRRRPGAVPRGSLPGPPLRPRPRRPGLQHQPRHRPPPRPPPRPQRVPGPRVQLRLLRPPPPRPRLPRALGWGFSRRPLTRGALPPHGPRLQLRHPRQPGLRLPRAPGWVFLSLLLRLGPLQPRLGPRLGPRRQPRRLRRPRLQHGHAVRAALPGSGRISRATLCGTSSSARSTRPVARWLSTLILASDGIVATGMSLGSGSAPG